MTSVLFLIPTLDRGGAENVLLDLVNHMDQSKFRITVQTLFDKDAQKDRLRDGIEYKTFMYHQFHGNSRLFSLIPARLLYRFIVREHYDVVVSYLEGPTTHIISGCPYKDSKTVAWIHSALDTGRGFSAGFVSERAAIKAYSSFDKISFVAKSVKEKIELTTKTVFPNSCILYNTVDTDEILSRAKEELNDCQFSKDEFKIFSVGKVTSVKGFDRLAHIQKRLVADGYRTHVYILGIGNDKESIEAYLKDNNISDSFTFLGFHDNPYKYVTKADLFICSSRREGFSTAVSEALILGIPVVSTNCSGAYELLGENSEYGLVTDNNEEALYQGIKKILDDPALLEYYRNQAAIRGRSFSTEETVRAVEDMLTELPE